MAAKYLSPAQQEAACKELCFWMLKRAYDKRPSNFRPWSKSEYDRRHDALWSEIKALIDGRWTATTGLRIRRLMSQAHWQHEAYMRRAEAELAESRERVDQILQAAEAPREEARQIRMGNQSSQPALSINAPAPQTMPIAVIDYAAARSNQHPAMLKRPKRYKDKPQVISLIDRLGVEGGRV